jgi:hypothetical protein
MAIDPNGVRSRRALLLGAAGGLGALAAHALGRPAALRAGTEYVKLGERNDSTTVTTIFNTVPDGVGFTAHAEGTGTVSVASP